MVKKLSTFVLIGLLCVTALAACGSGDDDSEAVPTVTRVPATNAPADATFFTPTPAPAATTAPAASPIAASPSAGSPEAAAPTTGAAAPATAISVEAGDLFFNPKDLAGAANTDVAITITNHGGLTHDFSIPSLNITSEMIAPGESLTITVNAAAGSYAFQCSVPGHADGGMTGTLTLS